VCGCEDGSALPAARAHANSPAHAGAAAARRFGQYARSKLCNTLFTLELQQRLQQRGIAATSVSPGFVSTNIFAGVPWGFRWLLQPLAPLLGRTPAKVGAGCQVAAASHHAPHACADAPRAPGPVAGVPTR
jgi:NAD(P)-dependent dehydrogenase (short-subunit alcohol dehydrogenase family)